jgi:hypothetical protein
MSGARAGSYVDLKQFYEDGEENYTADNEGGETGSAD